MSGDNKEALTGEPINNIEKNPVTMFISHVMSKKDIATTAATIIIVKMQERQKILEGTRDIGTGLLFAALGGLIIKSGLLRVIHIRSKAEEESI
jgi:cytidylate kinase